MVSKREIFVQKQKPLSLEKSFRFCLKGINHRLFRSTLTLAVVVMAVAFFMALLSENAILRSTAKGIEEEMLKLQEANLFLSYIYSFPSQADQVSKLALANGRPAKLEEFGQITGIGPDALKKLAQTAHEETLYLDFFRNLSIGKRRILVKKNRGRQIFSYLADDRNWQIFLDNLEPLRSLKLPTEEQEFLEFIKNYQDYQKALGNFSNLWNQRVKKLKAETGLLCGGKKIESWLVDAKERDLQDWRTLVNKHGFTLGREKVARIRTQLIKWKARTNVLNVLKSREKKKLWKETFFDNPPLDKKMEMLDHKKVVGILDNKYKREELAMISKYILYYQNVSDLDRYLAAKLEKRSGSILSGRQIFLLIISFVVCMVGIANAMLMAITERFREIATMKCLGATDGFILIQFLIEAFLQGFSGGIVGMLIGLALTLVKNSLVLGGFVFAFLPEVNLVYCAIFSIATGILLSMSASIYPSFAASRMAPMEAMRIE